MTKFRKLTENECELLRQNPYVKLATTKRFILHYEFRLKLYEYLELNSYSPANIRTFLSNNGFDVSIFRGTDIINHLNAHIKHDGKPSRGKNKIAYQNSSTFKSNKKDNDYLISTGKFIIASHGKGISFSPEFIDELYHLYPSQSIEDGLLKYNIDPDIVGYQRIYKLKQLFDGDEIHKERVLYEDTIIEQYKNHPYIKRLTKHIFVLKDEFYNEAYALLPMHIDDVLNVFEIDYKILSISSKNRIKYKLNKWKTNQLEIHDTNELTLKIKFNIMNVLYDKVSSTVSEVKSLVPYLNPLQRKYLCQTIDKLPKSPCKKYSKRYILSLMGISKSSYYSCLKNKNYGKDYRNKQKQDEKDIKAIQKVIAYKGYPKGTRIIYMMMNKITGKQFSINKIRRLKKKYGIVCQVRQGNQSRRQAQKLLEKNVCPNYLQRTFKMHKPNKVFLTDVTYMNFGKSQRAYGSASIDAVTGEAYAFDISDGNDLSLALQTINKVGHIPHPPNAILHSDQGTLYLSDIFQQKVKEYGFIQSMSKRGNCWDNAPQESFFGHFKDEVDYASCETIEELKKVVNDYAYYYNYERPQWNRNKMTPVQYRDYLNQLNKEDFQRYMRNETIKYNKMKEKAAIRAKERATTLGV